MENIDTALFKFEKYSVKHSKATLKGDSEQANIAYNHISKSIDYLKKEKELAKLLCFLKHKNDGVIVWASSYLLSEFEFEAKEALLKISKRSGIIASNARWVLKEWNNGNLKT